MSSKEYVLGTGLDELSRLGIQHRIWADATTAAWKRAGIGLGSKVLDVGSGPGYVSMDLSQLVGPSGEVLAIDESQNFVEFLSEKAKAWGLSQIRATTGDVQNLAKTVKGHKVESRFDAAYCRWVLCWLKSPEKALFEIRKALKPGGRLIIHDYFNWKSMTMGPRSEAIDKLILSAVKSFSLHGGDIDISARLPSLLKNAGFKVQHFDVHQRVARGGGLDSTLDWPVTWWRVYGPKLVGMGLLSEKDCKKAMKDLDKLESSPDCFFVCPSVYEFICS
jgi:ubiquinone/menaquinone biosynthesis C-methylase UbiE